MNPEITNIDVGGVLQAGDNSFDDNLLTHDGDVLEGTLLARSTATNKLVPYVKGGAVAGNGIVNSVLTYEGVTNAAPGDTAIRNLIAGKVRKDKLVIDADGDASNIDTDEIDALNALGIIASDVQELDVPDNPQA